MENNENLKNLNFINIDTVDAAIANIIGKQNDFQVKAMKQEDWWNVKVKNNKTVNYMIANLAEMGEAIDSLDYKWWGKDIDDNIDNFITEGIDAIHFCVSYHLQIMGGNQEALLEPIKFALMAIEASNLTEAREPESRRQALYDSLIHFTGSSSLVYMKITSLDENDEQTEEWKQDMLNTIYQTYKNLFSMLYIAGVDTFDEIVRRYMVKNALNNVRKLNGYEAGTYIKMWLCPMGIQDEDNKVALDVIKNLGISDFDQIVIELDNYYKNTVGL